MQRVILIIGRNTAERGWTMVSIGFTGDIAFTKYFKEAGSVSACLDESVKSFLKEADHCVCNLEGPATDRVPEEKGNYIHSSSCALAAELPELNLKIWDLANNHSLDFGTIGLKDTMELAEKAGCTTLGAGNDLDHAAQPLILDGAGGVGLLAITYSRASAKDGSAFACLNWEESDRIKNSIQKIKAACRWCVVIVHGGDEFCGIPMPYTRDKYQEMLSWGADILVGHHPHVVQNFETVGDKTIFYSLGNFIFDTDYQRAQKNTDVGILLKIRFYEDYYEWDHLPVRIRRDKRFIEATSDPAVFSDISERDYQKIAPFAATAFLEAEKRKSIFLHPEKYEKYSPLQWFIRELRRCRTPDNRCVTRLKFRAKWIRLKDGNLRRIIQEL